MSVEDYIDTEDPRNYFPLRTVRYYPPTCDRCGAIGKWAFDGARWLLSEHGKPHVCRVRPEEELDEVQEDERG